LLEPVEKWSNYTAFGSPMPGRSYFGSSPYRYGMNGQENDDEITGNHGTHTTAMFWEYDSRIGRRWNIDPVFDPNTSPYACFSDNPILLSDPNGDTPGEPTSGKTNVKNEPKVKGGSDANNTVPKSDRSLAPAASTAVKQPANLPNTPTSQQQNLPQYDTDASTKWAGGSNQLLAASRSNTQNMAYAVSYGEPANNAGVSFPDGSLSVSVGPVSINNDGQIGVTKSVGPYGIGTGGVDLKGYTIWSSDQTTSQQSYLVVQSSTGTYVKKVDMVDVVTQNTSYVMSVNNYQRFKNETYANGSSTGYVKTVDSTQFNMNVNISNGAYGVSISVPVTTKSNMPNKPAKNPFFIN